MERSTGENMGVVSRLISFPANLKSHGSGLLQTLHGAGQSRLQVGCQVSLVLLIIQSKPESPPLVAGFGLMYLPSGCVQSRNPEQNYTPQIFYFLRRISVGFKLKFWRQTMHY